MEAVAAGVAIIEIGHDVSEWPLVTLLEAAVRSVSGLDASRVNCLEPQRSWWNPDEQQGVL
jgi:hypothetical protein